MSNELAALTSVLLIVGIAENMQPRFGHTLLEQEKRLYHGLYIFNGMYTYDGGDVDIAIGLLFLYRAEAVHTYAVAYDPAFARVAAELDLNIRIAPEQRRYRISPLICTAREHVKHVYPLLTELRYHPPRTQYLLLALAGVDAVLGDDERSLVLPRPERGEHSPVAR